MRVSLCLTILSTLDQGVFENQIVIANAIASRKVLEALKGLPEAHNCDYYYEMLS